MSAFRRCKITNEKLKNLVKTRYFALDNKDSARDGRMIDLQKLLCFLLLYTETNKSNKVEIIVRLGIMLTQYDQDQEYSILKSSKDAEKLEINCEILLLIVSFMLSSVVLPFLYYYEDFNSDYDFRRFTRFCTTEPELFLKRAKTCLNILFEQSKNNYQTKLDDSFAGSVSTFN